MISTAAGFNVFKYDSPLVTMEQGSGWIVNGYFKLVHTINLDEYHKALTIIEDGMREMAQSPMKTIIELHLNITKLRLSELQGNKQRKPRSINWIGSAWKWIAGSPDAIDWDSILKTQNEIITNNNNQYVINEQIFNITRTSVNKVDEMIAYANSISKNINSESLEILTSNKLLVIKEQISEMVRASQMAKNGIVNTNLLDKFELERLISEEETLPYENSIEAAEYAKPSIYTNGTFLLYVLSVPKVNPQEYRVILARASSSKEKQVELQYKNFMLNKEETYGMTGNCFTINNTTICEKSMLKKLPEDGCDARLLKGGNANCHFIRNSAEIIELISDNTIFVTNFNGYLTSANETRSINGTFLVQLNNETLQIGNQTFTSKTFTKIQALPSVLTNVTSKGIKLNLEYIHALNQDNISHIKVLGTSFHISTTIEAVILGILAVTCYRIWKKITGTITIPNPDEAQKH